MKLDFRSALVIAPHPDDEILGAGGTIARLAADGCQVTVAIVTKGRPPMYDAAYVEKGRDEAREAHRLLGVSKTCFLDFPAAQLDTVPHHELNRGLTDLVVEARPEIVFIPFEGDIHLDHQRVALSSLVALRPGAGSSVRKILAYETLSETNWNSPSSPKFTPNVFIDVSNQLEKKLGAMQKYASQLRAAPDERSLKTIEALSTLRGATVHRAAAEAFVLVREIL